VICVILAAGYATRLYPLTENKPKCLLEVQGRTILDILCQKLEKLKNCEQIIIVTNDKFYEQLETWRKSAGRGLPIQILNDGTTSNDNRLGAIGDFGLAIRRANIETDVLLLASDNLFDQGFENFIKEASARQDALTVATHDLKNPQLAAKKYGVLEVDSFSQVIHLEEKPEFPKTSLIGMGVYYFPRQVLNWVMVYLQQKNAKDAPGYFVHWLLEKAKIFSFLFEGLWYDIGDLKSLEEANQKYRG
jgi:glucose-1-phosphate thymidylyltransferase